MSRSSITPAILTAALGLSAPLGAAEPGRTQIVGNPVHLVLP